MNPIRLGAKTCFWLIGSIAIVNWLATDASLHGQSNQLRFDNNQSALPLPSTSKASDENRTSVAPPPSVGQPLIQSQSQTPFQSKLQLPMVNSLESQSATEVGSKDRIELSSVVGKVAQATVFVVVICIGSLLLLRKLKADRFFSGEKKRQPSAESKLHLIGTLRLAGNRCMELIEVDGQKLVVLSCAGSESSMLLVDQEKDEVKDSSNRLKEHKPVFSLAPEPESPQIKLAKLGI